MKRIIGSIVLLLSLVFLSGCFETDFNFKTIIRRNGKIDREVHINGRGASRFLPPTGPQWDVKISQTKGGQSILEDTQYHIHANGHFIDSSLFTSDFRYDTAKLISDLTDETREEFRKELGIPEPFEKEIGAANRIELKRKRSLVATEYDYTEVFEIRWLIPILLHDLKKEIIREKTATLKSEPPTSSQAGIEPVPVPSLEPALLSDSKISELARKKLVEEILPKFQFHSEITMPGKIVSTNATSTHGVTALWDFQGINFSDDFSLYTLHVVSKAPNFGLIAVSILVVLGIVWIFVASRRPKAQKSSRRS